MSARTKAAWQLALLMLAGAAGGVQAQTLADLASAQRTKQEADMAKAKADLEAAQAAATAKSAAPTTAQAAPASQRPAKPPKPPAVVHSLYALNGEWVAEVVDGNFLMRARPGAQINGFVVERATGDGLVLRMPCKGAPKSCGTKVIRLGQTI